MTNTGRQTLTFAGKVALVAGASRGIGAETARAFARAGASVVLAARDQQALDSVVASIRATGGQARAIHTDVGDPASVEQLVRQTLTTFGRLDAAFNSATDGRCRRLPTSILPTSIAASAPTSAAFLGMKYQIPAMLRSGGGAIVNMASIAGLNGVANLAAYVAGKAGIIGLTRVAALDYADQGIRVNVVAPGPILTHHLERAGEEAQRGAALYTPMRRVGRAESRCRGPLAVLGPRPFITGATLPIDGDRRRYKLRDAPGSR